MKVNLISKTQRPLDIVYLAAKTCTSALPLTELMIAADDTSEESKIALVHKILKRGHWSVLEHIQFVFAIEGVSRALTHQLVRHRHFSYSQRSQRYVNESETLQVVMPESIKKNETYFRVYNQTISNLQRTYKDLIESGIPKEDARMVLPNAATSSIILSGNLRALLEFFNKRLCVNAQWEIRETAEKMAQELKGSIPWAMDYMKPNCKNCTDICRKKN